ncbi:MAG: efflux RND transporter periplasmic adaptor subunit [Planctomycetes bacterium]|nr:efflux RND transporter periplasmic adaptor subunit [Planctomycetota bacterium]
MKSSWIIACLLWMSVSDSVIAQQSGRAKVDLSSTDRALVVSNCRVSLVRRAALAGSRLGILREVAVEEGDLVEAGQVVATLRDDQARQALAISQKEMSNNVELRLQRKVSELATLEFSKAMELNRSIPGGVSELDVKKLRLAAEKAILQIEQADYQLQMAALRTKDAEITLESYRITAPFSGVVLQVQKHPGEALGAGDVVAEIANFDTMRVGGFIPLAASNRIQRGAAVIVEVAAIDSQHPLQFEGRVTSIAPIVNEVSQEIRVWAEVENRNQILKDGMPATMRVAVTEDVAIEVPRRGARPN